MGSFCSSAASTINAVNARTEQQHINMFQQVAQMQQQQQAQQEQMMRDDPECRALMDRQMQLQQRGLAALQSGDHGALTRIQAENMELLQNPKYMKMMMPSMAGTKMMGNTSTNNNAAGAAEMLQTMIGAMGGGHMNGNNGNGFPAPMASAVASDTNKPMKSSYSDPYTSYHAGNVGYAGGDNTGGNSLFSALANSGGDYTGGSMFSDSANDF